MITTQDIHGILSDGGTLVGTGGDTLGTVAQVFLDDETGNPEWVTVNTGLFGGSESFVPLDESRLSGNEITVPFDKATIKAAPKVSKDGDGHISQDQEAELYAYYGMSSRDTDSGHDQPDRTVGQDASGPNTDQAMTRSEEHLHVGTEKVATGHGAVAQVRRHRERQHDGPGQPRGGPRRHRADHRRQRRCRPAGADLTSEEHEVTLHAERPVVDKEVVPVERVRLDTETVTAQQQVTEEVRKEQIETDTSDVPDNQHRS